ncbi:MAG TPA: aspartate aminotransferase family protein [Acidimicrobiales bacterium]|nr:aspartate aminotransferase family protein [Acidimicrobiales bacterium]
MTTVGELLHQGGDKRKQVGQPVGGTPHLQVVEGGPDDERISARAREIFRRELHALVSRTAESHELFERARRTLPLGVASTFQSAKPYPIYLSHGRGAEVWDVDGTGYFDFHNGFGSMAVGHAHPKVVEAIERAARSGTHFAVTTDVAVSFAEELCRRFGLERVRFTNSGTEATMDAVRLARAATGRDVVVKIEGSYHGHHDAVMYSVSPSLQLIREADESGVQPAASRGIPAALGRYTTAVPYNDIATVEQLFAERGPEIACFILEPVMMNIGIVLPKPGYLQALRRLCTEYDVVLVFDEVKTGATIAAGGAAERFGVQPDLLCLAKSITGGTPGGAVGGRAVLMDQIGQGVAQQGTFNGNPLVAAAGLATLTEVLTPDAYAHFARIGTRLAEGCRSAVEAHGIAAHTVDLGCKGCVSYRRAPLVDYRSFLDTDADLFDASWAWLVNRGIFMTPGNEEQWTLSVQHEDVHVDRFVSAFGEFCAAVAG